MLLIESTTVFARKKSLNFSKMYRSDQKTILATQSPPPAQAPKTTLDATGQAHYPFDALV